MAKYTKALVNEICDELATGKHSIADTCKKVGITKETFYQWIKNKPDFSDQIKDAENKRRGSLSEMAKSGLAKLLDIHEYEEVITEYENDKDGKPVIKKQKRVKKKIMPNANAVIFALTNLEAEVWKNRQNTDLTNKGGKFEASSPFLQVIMNSSKNKSDSEDGREGS